MRSGDEVAHLEVADGVPAWCEVRRLGTGGPLSGPMLACWRDGRWEGSPEATWVDLAEAAATAAGIGPGALAGGLTGAARTS